MEVLSSRVLLRPRDIARSANFYEKVLGLALYREFGTGRERGRVFFLGGGFLEVSGNARSGEPAGPHLSLWLQVRDVSAEITRLSALSVTILREPRREPWGLVEAWIQDPDEVRICLVEVPDDHPLRRRD